MHFTQHKFDRTSNAEFYRTLKQRVNSYFTDNGISTKGNTKMVVKTICMIALFLIPFGIALSGLVTSTIPFLALWFAMGIGVAGIGLSVMHDANHGAYSHNERVNKALGRMMDLIGGSSIIWKLQHNVLHHTFTNIDGADHDLDGPPVLRFSPNQKHRPIHRFQHIHAWFFYQLMTLVKVIYADYLQAAHYRKMGLIKSRRELWEAIAKILGWKIIYVSYTLVLPLILAPVSPWLVVAGFVLMHCVTGFCLAVVFQAAHIMPDSSYPLPDENGMMETDWAVHQIMTTANFAPNNKWLSWFIGGLNFQVEHHLFSNICHIHYPELSKIVQQTASEFGIPYRCKETFRAAIADHARMLFLLSRPTPTPIPVRG